ncbi:DUF371 domain-containing protein [Methanocella sp. CWC-04]|uniref:DUF371 domain-containing protein n=1 Tax=Methanooceanicella nereidis TaxID=2052831 RepID=A0AAP2W5R2_9EURY|nr:DUF371 domain-containing protein [Methanocella sp. CWC-04]MCD1293609.1 DUF371 domain-containing protein [Methanocella sp. CWC-04]
MLKEVIRARGHKNVTATHRSTFEITKDEEISPSADCIIAVSADRSVSGLSDGFRSLLACDDAFITAVITSGDHSDTVTGWGSKDMTLSDTHSAVFRVSDFVCPRTIMIYADKPASRLDRGLVSSLSAGNEVTIELTVEKRERPKPSMDILF